MQCQSKKCYAKTNVHDFKLFSLPTTVINNNATLTLILTLRLKFWPRQEQNEEKKENDKRNVGIRESDMATERKIRSLPFFFSGDVIFTRGTSKI